MNKICLSTDPDYELLIIIENRIIMVHGDFNIDRLIQKNCADKLSLTPIKIKELLVKFNSNLLRR